MKPLKIVLVSTSLMRGGAETQVYLLATEFSKLGHEVVVVSLRDPEAYEEELVGAGIPVLSLGMRSGVPNPLAILRLLRLLRREVPDVVHAHMLHANLLARVTRLFYWTPILVSTAHSMIEGGRWVDLAYRLTDSLSSVTTNVCKAGLNRYVEVGAAPRAKILYMPNGLNGKQFEHDPNARAQVRSEMGIENRFVWLAVGALEEVKDYPLMLRSFKALGEVMKSTKLLIVSDGSLRASLEAECDEVGLTSDDVEFLGIRTDIDRLMSASDGFLMTSKWEGLPMVLLEASMAQLPIVSTRAGGAEEVVVPGAGVLVDSRDPTEIATAMKNIMSLSPSERLSMGQKARTFVSDNFTLTDIAMKWVDLYRVLTGDEA